MVFEAESEHLKPMKYWKPLEGLKRESLLRWEHLISCGKPKNLK